jgi:hypothetical protein
MYDISLDSGHRAEHFDTSLDYFSKAVFEIFDLVTTKIEVEYLENRFEKWSREVSKCSARCSESNDISYI